MTDLRKLDAAATQGVWGRFSKRHGPFKEAAVAMSGWDYIEHHDSAHDVSRVKDGRPKRVGSFAHAADAAFAEALVNAYRAGELVEAPKESE